MRDPNRIEPFLKKVAKVWHKWPDLRFGQLMMNFFTACKEDPFYIEDGALEIALDAYLNDRDPAIAMEEFEDEMDAAIAMERYAEFLKEGGKSIPAEQLWEELNLMEEGAYGQETAL